MLIRAGLVAGGVAAAAWAVRGRSSCVFGPSVWRGPRDRAAVALTFDDGPSRETPRLLDLLAEHGAAATFFQIGSNVERLPEVARAVREAGHEIGNHSHTHPYFHMLGPRGIESELARAQEAITRVTGARPRFLRVPYGVRWFGLGGAQQHLGLTGVMWTVIGLDWKHPAEVVIRRILNGLAGGAIICLHDGCRLDPAARIGATLEAVRQIIPAIHARGFKLVTLSQLLCPTN